MLTIKFYTFGPDATNYVEWEVDTNFVNLSVIWGFYDDGKLNICAEGLQAEFIRGALHLYPIS